MKLLNLLRLLKRKEREEKEEEEEDDFSRSTEKQKIKEDFSLKNGALILERSITYFNGNSLPFRIYSYDELFHATNGFQSSEILVEGLMWTLYEGCQEAHVFSVKVYNPWVSVDKIINEITIASQMGKHKNVLRFYGCCIETERPILVFEHITKGCYNARLFYGEDRLMPLENQVRIASEVATAATFLHQGTSRIVIHGYIRTSNIFFDDQDGAKLGDFANSMLIPLGEDHVQVEASHFFTYLAPETQFQKRFSEKTDVYSFGVTLLTIISQKKWSFPGRFVDGNLLRAKLKEIYSSHDDSGRVEKPLMECAELILMCLYSDPDLRPCMLDVAKTLTSIRKEIIAETRKRNE